MCDMVAEMFKAWVKMEMLDKTKQYEERLTVEERRTSLPAATGKPIGAHPLLELPVFRHHSMVGVPGQRELQYTERTIAGIGRRCAEQLTIAWLGHLLGHGSCIY